MWSRITNFLSTRQPSAIPTDEEPFRRADEKLAKDEASQPEDVSSPPPSSPHHQSSVPTDVPSATALQNSTLPEEHEARTISDRWKAARSSSSLIYAHKLRLTPDDVAAQGTDSGVQRSPLDTSAERSTSTPSVSTASEDHTDVSEKRLFTTEARIQAVESHFVETPAPDVDAEAPAAVESNDRRHNAVHENEERSLSANVESASISKGRFALLRAVASQWRGALPKASYLCVVGSISDARKMAPLIRSLRRQHGEDAISVCVGGDAPERTRDALDFFGVEADLELTLPKVPENIDELRTRMIKGFGKIIVDLKPEWLVVHGESVTAAMASIAAYYAHVPVAHLDGSNTSAPSPESFDESTPEVLHRLITSLFASVHFSETAWNKEALLRDGVPEDLVLVTGSTEVDVVHETCARLDIQIGPTAVRSSGVVRVLIIIETPETIANRLPVVCQAIRNLAASVPGLYQFVWPIQNDSRGTKQVHDLLDRVSGVLLAGPASYEQFLRYLSECDLVITDTEDVQQEAPSLGKPVLLMSSAAHRPEAMRAGITTLIGTDSSSIQAGVRALARKLSVRHGSITNPYGDGKAATRILDFFAGRQVLEFGRTTLPRLFAADETPTTRRLAASTTGY